MTDKVHSIIEKPHEFRVIHFVYHNDSDEPECSYIDLHLKKGELIRRLRFLNPVELEIEKGFSGTSSGMEILDVSERQIENIKILVRNFEQDPGIIFWASNVIELNKIHHKSF